MTYLLSIFLFIFSDTILPPAPSPSCCWPIPVCGPLFLVSPGWRGSGQEGIGNIVFLVVSCGQSFMWSLRCCESALWKVFLGRAGRGRPVLGHQVGAVLLVKRAEVEGQVEMQRYLRLWELPRPSQGPLPRPRRYLSPCSVGDSRLQRPPRNCLWSPASLALLGSHWRRDQFPIPDLGFIHTRSFPPRL